MRKIIVYILYISLLFSSNIIDKTTSIITEKFPKHIAIKHDIYHINKNDIKKIQNIVRQKFFRPELNIWNITSSDSSKYYGILDNVKGKSLPITFLVIYDSNGQVYNAEIIKYRESYGGEIKSKGWLNQFKEYKDISNYNVGDAIDGITGATISVKSVTKGIHKLSILIHKLINNLNE